MNVSSAMNKNKQSTCSGHDQKQPFPPLGYWRHSLLLLSLLAFLISCSGGGGSAGDASPSAPPAAVVPPAVVSSATLSGTVYDSLGNPISGATVSAFSTLQQTTTNDSGQFTLTNVAKEIHTVILSKEGFFDSYQLTDLSNGGQSSNAFVLNSTRVPTVPVQAITGYNFTTTSTDYGTATLNIPGPNTFTIGSQSGATTANIGVEFINLNSPLPVPLPSSDSAKKTLDDNDILPSVPGKQAPGVLVTVKPALLELGAAATLDLPTPDASLIGKRVLRFDPATHLWKVVAGALAGTPFNITKGGVYGVFYETTNKTGGINGTFPAGSVVFIGDEVVKISSNYNNNLSISQIHIPTNGALNLFYRNAAGTILANSVTPVSGVVSTIGSTTTVETDVSLNLVEQASGNSTYRISIDKPGEIRVTVKQADTPLSRRIVTVSTTIGVLNPADGKALTDNSGVAVIGLLHNNQTGVGQITATVDSVTTDPLNFEIVTPDLKFGAFFNDSFIEGSLKLGISGDLSAGGTTSVTAELVDSNDSPFTLQSIPIHFSSQCASEGKATLDASISTVKGKAVAIYEAKGCVGSDTITATANISGTVFEASSALTVAAAAVGSIQFVSVSPTVIGLKGSGTVETAVATFKIYDVNNQPISGQNVTFKLDTAMGGQALTLTTATSNASGEVRATVTSGTVASSVRVIATIDATQISTVSDTLVISTGLPDQDSFSISLDTFNPEAWGYDGETVSVTIRAADHFNNQVPDGTAIYFTTEGGVIEPSCTTTAGVCSVNWTSQNLRPADGRVTILATTTGEENFQDINGNGLFDNDDWAAWQLQTSYDLPEAYRDDNESGTYEAGEFYLDLNNDHLYSLADGIFNGTLCAEAAQTDGFCTKNLVHIRESAVLSMSSSYATFDFNDSAGPLPDSNNDLRPEIDLRSGACGNSKTITADVAGYLGRDINGNDIKGTMPNGTTITLTSDRDNLDGDVSVTVGNTLIPSRLLITVSDLCTDAVTNSTLEMVVTTPKGHITRQMLELKED